MYLSWILCLISIYALGFSSAAEETGSISPTSPPKPLIPQFAVYVGKEICLLVQFNAEIAIPYFNKEGGSMTHEVYLNTTSNTKSAGNCTGDEQVIHITFPKVGNTSDPIELSLFFVRKPLNTETNQFNLGKVTLNYTVNPDEFFSANGTVHYDAVNDKSQFGCQIGKTYKCQSKQTVELTAHSDKDIVPRKPLVKMSFFQAQAFRSGVDPVFSKDVVICSADYVSNKVIPIVVGVILAIMIITALVVFIIANRRRQAGYQEL